MNSNQDINDDEGSAAGEVLTLDTSTLELIFLTVTETNELVKSLKLENAELKRELKATRLENKDFQIRLTRELAQLKQRLNVNKQTVAIAMPKTWRCLPKTPFKTLDDFLQFEENIKNSEDFEEQLEDDLIKMSDNEPKKYIRRVWTTLLTDDVASKFSWRGTNSKYAVRSLTVTAVLRVAFQKKFMVGEQILEATCVKWFQTAGDRLKYYINKSK